MAADYFFIGAAIFGAVAGTVTDLKNRWVPDWVNYFLIFFGLGGHLIVSILNWSPWPIIYSAIAAGIFYAIGSLMFYAGVWGGGDAKMLVGFGALLPTLPATVVNPAPWPFLLTIWSNVLIFGSLFGILGILALAITHKQAFTFEFKSLVAKNKLAMYLSPIVLIAPLVLYVYSNSLFFLLVSLATLLLPLVFVAKAVENSCMFKQIKPSALVEGDWIAETIKVGDFTYAPNKSGIEKKDIEKLMSLEKSGKLKNIRVKEGLPYVPAMFAGLLLSVFYGDILIFLMEKITLS